MQICQAFPVFSFWTNEITTRQDPELEKKKSVDRGPQSSTPSVPVPAALANSIFTFLSYIAHEELTTVSQARVFLVQRSAILLNPYATTRTK